MKPGVSRYYNAFIEGAGQLGKVDEFKEPDAKSMKAETVLGYKIDIGVPEPMEAEITLSSISTVAYDAMAKMDDAKFVIEEEVIEDGKKIIIVHTMTGPFDADRDPTKIKETKKVKFKLYPHRYFKETKDEELLAVDVFALIFRIKGKDILEETRANIG